MPPRQPAAFLSPRKTAAAVVRVLILAGILSAPLQPPVLCAGQSLDRATNSPPPEKAGQTAQAAAAKAKLLDEIRIRPTADAFDRLGILDSSAHDDDGAIEAFRRALEICPKCPTARIHLGNLYRSENQTGLAETEFREALRDRPTDQNARYALGVLLLHRGEPAQAIPYLRAVSPQDLETRFALIRAYLQTARVAEALRLAAEVSDGHRDDPQLQLSLGVLLASERQYKTAQIELEKAFALSPADFDILFQLGQVALLNGDDQRADLALSRALAMEPQSPQTLYLLAQTYKDERRPLDALELLVRADKLSPDNPDTLYSMAEISMSQRFYEDAIPLLERAVSAAPARDDLHAALGECYFKAGKFDRSSTEFAHLAKSHPSARNDAFLGLSHLYLGRFADATRDFHGCLTLDPKDAFCLFELGSIDRMQGNTAEAKAVFLKVLRADPNDPRALLEMADLRLQAGQLAEASALLRRYVTVSDEPATGYYKLAMVDRQRHMPDAAAADLARFQTLSKEETITSRPYDHLFDDLYTRSRLSPLEQARKELAELVAEAKAHPGQPDVLAALAAAYLKTGDTEQARETVARLDEEAPDDARALIKTGVLLARYGLYGDAIRQFTAARKVSPASDDATFDLANAYFRAGRYADALATALQVTAAGRNDDSYLALLADIYGHLGETEKAEQMDRDAIRRNPDNDQSYLSLALLELRNADIEEARRTLWRGQKRVPASGKLLWGLGVASALQGNNAAAALQLERAVDLLPEWPGAYSTLGFFYYQTGQMAKADEVFARFRNSGVQGGLDLSKIEAALEQGPHSGAPADAALSPAGRTQFLQFALLLADKTL